MVARTGATVLLALSIATGCDADLAFERRGDAGADAGGSCIQSGCPIPTLHCDSTTGRCEECVLDGDCPFPLARCDVASHRCFECLEESDCPTDATCVVEARKCVRTCTGAAQCMRGMCDTANGTCRSCITNLQCFDPRRRICETLIGQCVECTRDADCPKDHPRCDPASFRCSTCLGSEDCSPDRPYCEPSRHICVSS